MSLEVFHKAAPLSPEYLRGGILEKSLPNSQMVPQRHVGTTRALEGKLATAFWRSSMPSLCFTAAEVFAIALVFVSVCAFAEEY